MLVILFEINSYHRYRPSLLDSGERRRRRCRRRLFVRSGITCTGLDVGGILSSAIEMKS